jgi:PAS domain S-box-containing protein
MAVKNQLNAGEQTPHIQRFCRYLSELSPQPMVAVDGTTHVVSYLNPAFARLVGKAADDLIGRPFAQAVPEGTQNGCLALLDRVFRTGTPEILAEQEHRQSLPRPIYWSYSMWAILGEDGLPAGVMIQVTDVTETALFRQQAVAMNETLLVSGLRQHELTEAGKSFGAQMQAAVQRRDHFLAVLSHELRNPLTALTAGMQLLKIAGRDPVMEENSRDMMERQLKQLVFLVNDLLDVSRIATGKLELRKVRIDLTTVLREAMETCRPLIDSMDHTLTFTLPPEPILLDADSTRLGQVFLNLLNNAAKYSEPGGRISLSAVLDGGEVVVSIRDAGIGIAAAQLPKIFDVFVQVDTSWKRSQGGLGIGLSLVNEFVGLHGGRVEARSDGPGKGSEFIVHLPLAVGAPDDAPPLDLFEKASGPQRRVLVVDDNRDAAESLAMLLRIHGHEVLTAYDGDAGAAATAVFRPELILMDIGMPKLDGYDAARRIRAEPGGSEPILVALTGWGADTDRQRTRGAGFDQHMVKPVDVDVLVQMIAEMPERIAQA